MAKFATIQAQCPCYLQELGRSIQNESARVSQHFYYCRSMGNFADAHGQLTPPYDI